MSGVRYSNPESCTDTQHGVIVQTPFRYGCSMRLRMSDAAANGLHIVNLFRDDYFTNFVK